LTANLEEQAIKVYFPEQTLCQDNAAMVAGLGYQLYKRGVVSDLNLEVEPNLKVERVLVKKDKKYKTGEVKDGF